MREGAFLVARGRLAHEEATGTNVWVDSIVALSGAGAHLRALATAVDHQAELTRVPGPEDLATLVHELVQQQAAFGQQQAALVQLRAETVRLPRLLIERALGVSGLDTAGAPSPDRPTARLWGGKTSRGP